MKRITLLFCLCLWTVNVCFSQTTYPKILGDSLIVITQTQLKQTNLIFNEHNKLLITDSLLRKQVGDYKNIVQKQDSIDVLRLKQIDVCKQKINESEQQISDLTKKNKRISKISKIKTWIIGCLTASTGILSLLL